MGNVIGQMIFKTSLISFLGVSLWGLLSDLSFEQVIFRSAVTALAIYFTIIIYLSGLRLILRSDVKKKDNEEV
ncbi:MAG: hypothetical protein IIB94_00080 [Candidatus Marinimicrobia bacterium]|nr:hypothetical protein [Candidatus Neomarinimicrobiota bacterium]